MCVFLEYGSDLSDKYFFILVFVYYEAEEIWTSTAEQGRQAGDDGDVLDWVTDSEQVTGLYKYLLRYLQIWECESVYS